MTLIARLNKALQNLFYLPEVANTVVSYKVTEQDHRTNLPYAHRMGELRLLQQGLDEIQSIYGKRWLY